MVGLLILLLLNPGQHLAETLVLDDGRVAPVALARSSNTAMEHRNRCTDLRHPELLATALLKCPRQDCCETPSEAKKIGKLSPLSSFIFLTLRERKTSTVGMAHKVDL